MTKAKRKTLKKMRAKLRMKLSVNQEIDRLSIRERDVINYLDGQRIICTHKLAAIDSLLRKKT